jgi:hypothetical protein
MQIIGHRIWAIPAGYIPLQSTGKEPEMVSQDCVSILNTHWEKATINITVYYQEQDPIEGYCLQVEGKRVKKIRINDLIDPLPVDLEKPFSLIIIASHEVIVQFTKKNTAQRENAMMGTIAFHFTIK